MQLRPGQTDDDPVDLGHQHVHGGQEDQVVEGAGQAQTGPGGLRPGVGALERAHAAGVAAEVVAPGDHDGRTAWDEALAVATHKPNVWIDLSKPTYGIHGTPEPGHISRTQSSGCVRLTNFAAEAVASAVKAGTPVTFQE